MFQIGKKNGKEKRKKDRIKENRKRSGKKGYKVEILDRIKSSLDLSSSV